jgi:hypothetical protein
MRQSSSQAVAARIYEPCLAPTGERFLKSIPSSSQETPIWKLLILGLVVKLHGVANGETGVVWGRFQGQKGNSSSSSNPIPNDRAVRYGRSIMPSLTKRIGLTIFALLVCSALRAAQTVSPLESRRKTLNDLLAEQWEYTLRTNPLYASTLGDKRWNDKLDDFSQEAIDKDLLETQKFLVRFEAIDTTGFPKQETMNKSKRPTHYMTVSPIAFRHNLRLSPAPAPSPRAACLPWCPPLERPSSNH